MSAEKFAAKPFAPLPVMGVPGWCSANVNPDFTPIPKFFAGHLHIALDFSLIAPIIRVNAFSEVAKSRICKGISMKRIMLFVLTNLAVMVVLGLVTSLLV